MHHRLLLSALTASAVLICSASALAQAPDLAFRGDHRVVGASGQDRRAMWGTSEAGATLRFFAVDKAAPSTSCAGAALAATDVESDGRWSASIDGFRGILFAQATGASGTSDCLPVFVSTLPLWGSTGTRSGTAITYTIHHRLSNPASDEWPLRSFAYEAVQTTTAQISSYASRPATIDVGGVVLESPERPYGEMANLRFGTSYTKAHSQPRSPYSGFTTRTTRGLYGATEWPYMRVRVYAGSACTDDRLVATTYADDRGQWSLPRSVADADAVSVAVDLDGAEPVPSAAIPLSQNLHDYLTSVRSTPACAVDRPVEERTPPAAPLDAELLPDPANAGGALVRATLPPDDGRYRTTRVAVTAARDAACTGTGAWLAPTRTHADFAAGGVRVTDAVDLDVDRVGVRVWSDGAPSDCTRAIAHAERTLTLTLGAEQVTAGEATPVRVAIANAGPWPTTATTVRLRAGTGAALRAAGCTPDGDDLVCSVPPIASGTRHDLTLVATGTAAGTTTIAATLAADDRDTNAADDTATGTLRVAAPPAAPLTPVFVPKVLAPQPPAAPSVAPAACRSRRAFTVTVPAPRATIRRVVVRVDTVPVPVVRRGGRATATIDLRGRPRGTAVVTIKRTPARGRSSIVTRRYATCTS